MRRMIAENVYPTSVQTTPEALKTAMNTQTAHSNLKEQPDCASLVIQDYVKVALPTASPQLGNHDVCLTEFARRDQRVPQWYA